jgi:hypothetical protein
MVSGVTARGGGLRDWQRWAPYAAVVWSMVYAALGIYWIVSGRGFPYGPELVSDDSASVVGRLGPVVAWVVVIAVGVPAVAVGTAMLRGARMLRSPHHGRSSAGGSSSMPVRSQSAGDARLHPHVAFRLSQRRDHLSQA